VRQSLLRLLQGSRIRLAVIAAVLCALALSGTLLALSASNPDPTDSQPPQAAAVAQATETATSTVTPHLTATPHHATPNKHHANPPAPPVPTPPPAPSVTPCPTATSLPKPTATAIPVPTATDTPTAGAAAQRYGGSIQAMAAAACQPCPYYRREARKPLLSSGG
jgi:outer membrane biosynthesis protein TonB